MDTLDPTDTLLEFDILADLLELEKDQTPLDLPEVTAEDLLPLAHMLPLGFFQPRQMPITAPPAPSALTAYTQKISIRVQRPVMTYLREEAHRRGVGYQTVMNMILTSAATGQNFNGPK